MLLRPLNQAARAITIVVSTMFPGFVYGQASLITSNSTGVMETIGLNGNTLATSGPMFQSLGTNGRMCVSCHVPGTAWGLSATEVQARFLATAGLDPLFRTVDGSNSPNNSVSTLAQRQSAYSMLLKRGTIRVGLPVPSYAVFSLTAVDDPYGFATAAQLSLFRKPLPATNLRFLSTVMWDGRFSFVPTGAATVTIRAPLAQNEAALFTNLMHQASDAIKNHAQGATSSSQSLLTTIVNFEIEYSDGANHRSRRGPTRPGRRAGRTGLPLARPILHRVQRCDRTRSDRPTFQPRIDDDV